MRHIPANAHLRRRGQRQHLDAYATPTQVLDHGQETGDMAAAIGDREDGFHGAFFLWRMAAFTHGKAMD